MGDRPAANRSFSREPTGERGTRGVMTCRGSSPRRKAAEELVGGDQFRWPRHGLALFSRTGTPATAAGRLSPPGAPGSPAEVGRGDADGYDRRHPLPVHGSPPSVV